MCEFSEFILKTVIEGVIVGGVVAFGVNFFIAKYERKKVNREKAILIAELLSEWNSDPTDRKKLNQLTWEASIWLPKDLLKKLNQRLRNIENAPNAFELVAETRKIILGDNEAIDVSDVTWFSPKKEEKTK